MEQLKGRANYYRKKNIELLRSLIWSEIIEIAGYYCYEWPENWNLYLAYEFLCEEIKKEYTVKECSEICYEQILEEKYGIDIWNLTFS